MPFLAWPLPELALHKRGLCDSFTGGDMSDGSAILLTISGTVVGAALGAVTTWYVDHRSRLKSSVGLDAALGPLVGNDQKALQALNAIGRILEQNGQGTFSRDEAGHITGIVITASARDVLSFPSERLRSL